MMRRGKVTGSSADEEKDAEDKSEEAPAREEQLIKETSSPKGGGVKRRRKRTKKAKGAPRRPLSAYNAFFKEQRTLILQERAERARSGVSAAQDSGDLFASMGRKIAKAWKELTPTRMKKYKKIAEADMKRYQTEMEEYRLLQALHKVEGRQKTSASDDDEDRKPAAKSDPGSAAAGGAQFMSESTTQSQKPLSHVVQTGEQHLKFPAAPAASAVAQFHQQQQPLDSTLALVREARAAAQRLRGDVQDRQTVMNSLPYQSFAASAPMFLPQAYQQQQELVHPYSVPDLSALRSMPAGGGASTPSRTGVGASMMRTQEAPDYLSFLQEQNRLRAALQEHQQALERQQALEQLLSLQQQQRQQQLQPGQTPQFDLPLVEWLRRRELQEALAAQLRYPGAFNDLQQLQQQQQQQQQSAAAAEEQQARASILEILRRDRAVQRQPQSPQQAQDDYELLLQRQQQQRRRNNRDDPSGGSGSGSGLS